MGIEIERKFLVKGDAWRAGAQGEIIRQGYLCSHRDRAVRVRLIGDTAFLTVKGEKNGLSRAEYEYPIPVVDAAEMLDCYCQRPLIEKTRYTLHHAGIEWTVDVFAGDNTGLVLAEVELDSPTQDVPLPDWLGREVSDDPRFLNVSLVSRPFGHWPDDERAAVSAAGKTSPAAR